MVDLFRTNKGDVKLPCIHSSKYSITWVNAENVLDHMVKSGHLKTEGSYQEMENLVAALKIK